MFNFVMPVMLLSFLSTATFAASVPTIKTSEEAQKIVSETFKDAVNDQVRHFCLKETMTCRTLISFKNKITNKRLESFRISFYSAERMVAASEYYINVEKTNKYLRLVDSSFDGAININKFDEVQTVVKTNYDIIIKDLMMPRLGTTRYIQSDLIFSQDKAYLEGFEKDTQDATINVPVRIDYPLIERN